MTRMIPVVVLIQEHDYEKLLKAIEPLVEKFCSDPRTQGICRAHGWTVEMLAWSTVLHQAAIRLQ